jgi:hypothetical protein
MTITAQDLIDLARIRHWAFADVALGDGAALLFLNQRQRHLLLRFRDQLRGLVNTTVAQAGVINGVLVGLDANGNLYQLATFVDGFAVHVDGGGNLYVDSTESPIAYDPLGARGGAGAGWPLPPDAIAIFNVFATMDDGSKVPVGIVDERDQHISPQGHYLAAYLSGNRIVPCRPPSSLGLGATPWNAVTGVTLSYLPLVSFTSLTDPAKVPAPLIEPLIANLAELLANQSKLCPVAEKRTFERNARKAEDEIDVLGYDIMGDAQTTSVIYEG